ncbi:MAG: OPT family oligopeptide transporter [Planctomycetota bacterium]|jgi:OPT family oligopeptide transporter
MSQIPDGPSEPSPTVTDPYEDYELPVEGFTGTPEEVERQWYEQCYLTRGDNIAQLTWRAVLMGSALGGILSLTNLYIGLKAGWGFGVAITACILSYALWTTFYRMRLVRTKMTILENNCMQSAASSAGYSTGGTLVSAFAAYIMLNNETLPMPIMFGWVFFLAVLGVTMAIPMKRQMINIEQLRFPSGIAAAETLRALHATGEKGIRAGKALGLFGILAAISTFWSDGLHVISSRLEAFQFSTLVNRFNQAIFGDVWIGRTVTFLWEPIFIAAGAIVGMRVSLSIMFGAITCWMIFVPITQAQVPEAAGLSGYRSLVQWTLWGGVACMVTSGLLSVALQWRSATRAFKSLGAIVSPGRKGKEDPVDKLETPISWFIGGQLISLVALAWLAHYTFGMPYWQTALAVVLTFGLALVACRVTGETDTTPVGAMGKIMQLVFGSVSPGNMNVNLMAANITAGAAGSSADLLTDLKSGYLLGAHPTKQFIAQFSGIFIGTLVTVSAFQVLVPNADALGTDQFPAPAAQAWKGVAEAISLGLSSLHPVKVWSIVIGGLVGILLPILAKVFPKKVKYIPSAAGVGLAWTFHWYYSLLFFLGAIVGLGWQRKNPKNHEEFLFPVASGVIAGGALMGVLLVFMENGPEMVRKLFGG